LLSADTHSKVQGVLEGCGDKIDDKCYQDVHKVLKESELQLDSQKDRRHFGNLLSKTFRKNGVGFVLSTLTGFLMVQWNFKHADEDFSRTFMPHAKIDAASILVTATTVIISGEGKPVATITQMPDTTVLQGYVYPCFQLVEEGIRVSTLP
jgi:hypothetical protein